MAAFVTFRLATPDLRPVVERLSQLYSHDLSEFRRSMPDAEGIYRWHRLPKFFEDPDRCAYLIYSDSSLAGFALVRGLSNGPRAVSDFFIVRAARRQRVGHRAALELPRRHPGCWEIAFQEENPAATRFWRHVATDAVGSAWGEERRPVPGKTGIPPDTWLFLDSST